MVGSAGPAVARRSVVSGIAAAGLLASCRSRPRADGPYPSRDIEFIIPYGAGGGSDVFCRLLGAGIARALPRRVEVVPMNVASGGGGKGITELFRAPPDGYTIGIMHVPAVFVLQRLRHLDYDLGRFTWLAMATVGEHYAMAVPTSSPVRSIADLQRLSRRRELTFTATGPEGVAYSATLVATRMLGLRARMVTGYHGSNDYVIGAMRGDADAVVAAIGVFDRLRHDQSMRVIATFDTEHRYPEAPNAIELGIPDIAKFTSERVIAAPPGLPEPIKQVLAAALAQAVRDPKIIDWARKSNEQLSVKTPAETAALMASRRAFFDEWMTGA